MTEHKIDMNITKYNTNHDGTQNRHEHYEIKNLRIMEHKTDMKIKKLKSTSTAEHKTDMNMTEKLSSTFTTEY